MMMCIAAIGISIGCIISGKLGNHYSDEIRRVPLYGLLLVASLTGIFFLKAGHYIVFGVLLFLVGVLAGMFKVPLDAEIQRRVQPDLLNTVLAYFNQVSFLFMLLASVTYYLLTLLLPQRYVFLMLAVVLAGASVWLYAEYTKTKRK